MNKFVASLSNEDPLIDISKSIEPILLNHFNEFDTLIFEIERNNFNFLRLKHPYLVKSCFEVISNSLSVFEPGTIASKSLWLETYRQIALEQYRRIVRVKLTVVDEKIIKRRAKLRTQIVDEIFIGLYNLISMFEEMDYQRGKG